MRKIVISIKRLKGTVQRTKEKNYIVKHIAKKNNKAKEKLLSEKAKNTDPIRVIYKRAGETPEIKIIDNAFKLKKAIIEYNLEIIPYEKVYIICNNQKEKNNMEANIALNLRSIYGDFILVKIDRKQREFKGLSQEDIMWYSEDLINKSYITPEQNNLTIPNSKKEINFRIRDLERCDNNINSNTFEKELISVLISIEMVLASLIKDTKK